jgi:pyridoxal phosphate enzyme (YggS family)
MAIPEADLERFRARAQAVHERIASAAAEAGSPAAAVRLIAVSKYASIEQVRVAIESGHRDFGENYVQDAFGKMDELGDAADCVRWHMIGALQSNKAARVSERFDLVHTLSSAKAARAISRAMQAQGRVCSALLQIHLGGGEHRAGVGCDEAPAFLEDVADLPGLQLDGVMGVAPPDEPARPHFAALRGTLEKLRSMALPNAPMRELSAGMSGDFEDAVREGATLVRVGSALFGD